MAEHAASEGGAARNHPRALLAQVATALRFLTIVPVRGGTVPVGASALFFPLVGLGLGAVLVALDAALAAAPAPVRNVLLVAALAVLTGGLHLDGLADAADSLLARDRARALAIMRDAATGAFGAVALVLVLLLKIRSLDALAPPVRAHALLFAPMLARWAIVALAFGSRPARLEGLGFAMVRSITFRELAGASVLALGVTLAWTEALGLLVILALGLLVIGCRLLVHRALGGVTGDVLGAAGELGEAVALAIFALAAGGGRAAAP
jgi:adenosylcobinamide-GDP ribazoletransferase